MGAGSIRQWWRKGAPDIDGLPGMRERAKRIGAELSVWSGVGSGTEVELSAPGAIAYGTGPGRGRWWWRRKARLRDGEGL